MKSGHRKRSDSYCYIIPVLEGLIVTEKTFRLSTCKVWEHAVVQLVEALRYKPEVCGFDSRWCHWSFSFTKSFRPHCGPGVDSAPNRKEYQEYFLGGKGGRCVGLTTLPHSCSLLSWNLGASTSWDHQGLSRPVMGLLLAYTDVPETAGLAKSINTQPAVRRNSETNPTSQHNRGMY